MSSRFPTRTKNASRHRSAQPDPSHAYAELAVTTNFSFLRGASHPEELMRQAIALGLTGIGIADRNSVAGVVRAYQRRSSNSMSTSASENERTAPSFRS